jgi:cyanophycinase-like exopeptidase
VDRTFSVFGSGEFMPWSVEVDRYALQRASAAGTGDGSVVVIPAASAPEGDDVFDSWARKGIAHYSSMEVPVRVSALKTRADAHSDDHVAQLEGASMFYFSGGNPAYLADILRDTPFWKAILDAVGSGAALAGCSAGACVMGETAPDPTRMSLSPESWAAEGLRVLPGLAFGPHWDMMETWIPGIHSFIVSNTPDGCRLVALDEDTAMVGDGKLWQVFGVGAVQVYEAEDPAAYRAGEEFTT